MADHAGDLIVDLVCKQYRWGDRYQHVDNEPIRLQEKIVDQSIAVVGPDHWSDRQMMPPMDTPIKQPGVDQSMEPIKPGVEQRQRGDDRYRCPADARQRPQPPAEFHVGPMTAAEHCGNDRERKCALPQVATDLRYRSPSEGLNLDGAAVQSRDDQACDDIGCEQRGVESTNRRQQRTELAKKHICPPSPLKESWIVRDADERGKW